MTDTTDIVRALERINVTLEDISGYISELAGYVPNPPTAQASLPLAPQPEAKPAPQGCAPEGIAPPDNQVSAPCAASTDVSTADESAAVAPQPEPEPDPEPEPLQLEPAPEQEPEPSFEEMQAKLLEVARALGNDAVSNILAAADAWSAADVPPWKRAEVIKACDEAIVADESGEAGWEE